jgi:hypothetical protein
MIQIVGKYDGDIDENEQREVALHITSDPSLRNTWLISDLIFSENQILIKGFPYVYGSGVDLLINTLNRSSKKIYTTCLGLRVLDITWQDPIAEKKKEELRRIKGY